MNKVFSLQIDIILIYRSILFKSQNCLIPWTLYFQFLSFEQMKNNCSQPKQYHSGIKPPNGTQPMKRGLVPNLLMSQGVLQSEIKLSMGCISKDWGAWLLHDKHLPENACYSGLYVQNITLEEIFFVIVNNPFHFPKIWKQLSTVPNGKTYQ